MLELKGQLLKPECTGTSHRWFRRYFFFPFVRVSVAVKVCHVQKCRVMVDLRSTTAAQYLWGKGISVSDNPFTSVALQYKSTATTTPVVLVPFRMSIVTVLYCQLTPKDAGSYALIRCDLSISFRNATESNCGGNS